MAQQACIGWLCTMYLKTSIWKSSLGISLPEDFSHGDRLQDSAGHSVPEASVDWLARETKSDVPAYLDWQFLM